MDVTSILASVAPMSNIAIGVVMDPTLSHVCAIILGIGKWIK